jgi:hypothetical protein
MRRRWPSTTDSAEWEIDDLMGSIIRRDPLCDEQKILDHLPHRQRLRDGYDAGHRLTSPDPIVRARDQCGDVVRQDDSSFGSGSGEHLVVGCATKTKVLHAHQIGLRDTSQKPPNEVVVEILVDQEANHAGLDDDRLARSRARMPAGANATSILPRTAAVAS